MRPQGRQNWLGAFRTGDGGERSERFPPFNEHLQRWGTSTPRVRRGQPVLPHREPDSRLEKGSVDQGLAELQRAIDAGKKLQNELS